jgi:probable rRNA maturation factor
VAEGSKPRLAKRRLVGGDGEPLVFCADEQSVVEVDLARWQRLAERCLHTLGVRGLAELSVMYVGIAEITELNEEYLDGTGPTDVLSFPIDVDSHLDDVTAIEVVADARGPSRAPDRAPADIDDMPLMLGDIVICPEVAAAQAPSHAGTVDDEFALLLVHGILHVLGHDHGDADEAQRMRVLERELLEAHHWQGPAPEGFRHTHPDDPDSAEPDPAAPVEPTP